MVTVEDCVTQMEHDDPKLTVVSVKDYGSDFLVTYSYEGVDELPDPFCLINKSTGKVEAYTIAEDPDRYYSAKELLKR